MLIVAGPGEGRLVRRHPSSLGLGQAHASGPGRHLGFQRPPPPGRADL